MKLLFHLGHPAHFHLFKNVIKALSEKGHQIHIVIKRKDILEDLLRESKIKYTNLLPKGRKDNIINIGFGQLIQNIKLFKYCYKNKIELLLGTSVAISHVGKLLSIPSINFSEDDFDVVPLYAKMAYPWATHILAPKVCKMGKWKNKTIFYDGYQELAYLHKNHFIPEIKIAAKYIIIDKPYFLLRFAKLGAFHDSGIQGFSDKLIMKIIKILKPFGNIYITSERKLPSALSEYKIKINPTDIHHVIAYSKLYIGDSQTMAAEAAILGTPFIRFNDFVGRIGYLNELENKYCLGFGFKTNEVNQLLNKINELVKHKNLKKLFERRKNIMLSDKIDYASFLIWFIDFYPKSINIIKKDSDFQNKFK